MLSTSFTRRWLPEIGLLVALVLSGLAVLIVYTLVRDPDSPGVPGLGIGDSGPVHVHGLGAIRQ